jgi:hypothetical protein
MQAVDAADYWKPLITPMECEIALVRGRSWTGQYDFDFRPLLATPLPQVFLVCMHVCIYVCVHVFMYFIHCVCERERERAREREWCVFILVD